MNEGRSIECRKLEPGSGSDIANLHRNAFAEKQWRYSIYASSKIGNFIDSLIANPLHEFVGAFEGRTLVGYTHVRYLDRQPHLNYIAVDTSRRGFGIGSALFQTLLNQSVSNRRAQISLDVSESSEPARSWYAREGFKDTSSSNIYLATAIRVTDVDKEQFSISTSDDQLKRMDQFEISDFDVVIGKRHFSVGIIGAALYRVSVDHDQRLINVLSVTDEHRETMVVIPSTGRLNCSAELIDRSLRMVRSL